MISSITCEQESVRTLVTFITFFSLSWIIDSILLKYFQSFNFPMPFIHWHYDQFILNVICQNIFWSMKIANALLFACHYLKCTCLLTAKKIFLKTCDKVMSEANYVVNCTLKRFVSPIFWFFGNIYCKLFNNCYFKNHFCHQGYLFLKSMKNILE